MPVLVMVRVPVRVSVSETDVVSVVVPVPDSVADRVCVTLVEAVIVSDVVSVAD